MLKSDEIEDDSESLPHANNHYCQVQFNYAYHVLTARS